MATCSECTYLDLGKEYEAYDCKYWCDKWHEWKYADAAECYGFCRAYGRSSSVSESYRKRSQDSQNSGCFITTIVSNVLENPDNNEALNKLRDFRNNVLQKNKKYLEILITYDIVGPIISHCILNDPNDRIVAKNLYNLGIKGVVDALDEKNYDKAVSIYTNMVQLLIEGYHINQPDIRKIDVSDVPTEQLGHGKQYVKKSI